MTDRLRRSLAPITDAAWTELEQLAARTLRGERTGRRLVDFSGPHGWHHAGVNLGTLDCDPGGAVDGVDWATRRVLALTELRVPFRLNRAELETLGRGCQPSALEALTVAARKAASFEETAIFLGFREAGIRGLFQASSHPPMPLGSTLEQLAETVELAVLSLQTCRVGGPYALALGTEAYKRLLSQRTATDPLRQRVQALATGGIHWSPALPGGVLLSRRGGDFELTVGQDMTIGYRSHDAQSVELQFTESFTFRVLESSAAIELSQG